MWLFFSILLIIAITFFVMVNSNENFKLSGKFKHLKKNKFQHEIHDGAFYQGSFIEIIGPKLDSSVEKVVTAFLVRDFNSKDQKCAVMVLVNDLKLGYLSDEDAIKFMRLLKLNNLTEESGINVQALIYGDWGTDDIDGNFQINLNISKDLSDSDII
ncbi:hypothetical protein ACG9HX_15760 [Acinetobacter ursingii]|jgi:hypothetical protein|uniref:HIRAN domain-containing protein n=1 Tax=Acinetobacter ursingii TaxID=108980 RepID=A0AA46NZG4_9GAMM|nr:MULTISPECIES: hypothetical protein [Acinetobacter]UYF73701.1 hypothetical protein LSO60_18395 [Acinetobacter ursingii]